MRTLRKRAYAKSEGLRYKLRKLGYGRYAHDITQYKEHYNHTVTYVTDEASLALFVPIIQLMKD